MLWTPPTKSVFSAKLETPPTCLSIEKELRQEPDVRSAGTSSTQTRAPKEFCNTKHGCWMNLHMLRIRQLLKHRLSWNYVPLRPIQVTEISLRTQTQLTALPVREKIADGSLRSQLTSSIDSIMETMLWFCTESKHCDTIVHNAPQYLWQSAATA